MLTYFRHVESHKVFPDGRRAEVQVASRGQSVAENWDVTGDLAITKISSSSHIKFKFEVPLIQFIYHGEFQLSADGNGTTILDYSAQIKCDHALLQRWRNKAHKLFREHVIDLMDRIKAYCETHPLVRKTRERPTNTQNPTGLLIEGDIRHNLDNRNRERGTANQRPSSPPVRSDIPWLEAAQKRLGNRLRRLVEESDSDERRTSTWTTLDQLARSLRYPNRETEGPRS